ncbi:MAG: PAS domain S-box protein [Chloroflexi bacterium]|nr:PAS domain S-box protein [Chloroflexota bacterium]
MKQSHSPHTETYQALSPKLLESAPDAVVVADRDGRIALVNAQAERLFGYRREELLGQFVEVLLPDRLHTAHVGQRADYHAAPAVRPMGSARLPVARRKDGSEFPIECSLSPLETADGVLVVSVIRDITERAQREAHHVEELAAMAQLSSRLLETLDLAEIARHTLEAALASLKADAGGLLLPDTAGRRLEALASTGWDAPAGVPGAGQASAARSFEVGEETAAGYAFAQRTPVQTADMASETRFRVPVELLELGLRSALSVPMLAGERVLGALQVNRAAPGPFDDHDVRLLGLIANQAGTALQRAMFFEELRLYKDVFESTVDAVMITDLQSRILDVNPAFERLTGFRRAEALGQKPGLIKSPHSTPAFYRQMWEQILTQGYWAGEIANRRKNGTTWDSFLTVSTVKDECGRPAAYVGVNRDITELKNLQREREALLESEQQQARQLATSYDHTLDALAAALDARDKETEGHSRRVVAYTLALARRMNISEEDLATIRRGALLHDIGKIGVPDAILLKPGPLTDAERAIMRCHPEWGERILQGIPFLDGAREIVCAHQERWDGAGYPRGLAGEAIPPGARIFPVADTFDAITSDRPYRAGRPYAVARAEIEAGWGTQFDPRAVEAFLQVPEEEWARLRAESLTAPDSAKR